MNTIPSTLAKTCQDLNIQYDPALLERLNPEQLEQAERFLEDFQSNPDYFADLFPREGLALTYAQGENGQELLLMNGEGRMMGYPDNELGMWHISPSEAEDFQAKPFNQEQDLSQHWHINDCAVNLNYDENFCYLAYVLNEEYQYRENPKVLRELQDLVTIFDADDLLEEILATENEETILEASSYDLRTLAKDCLQEKLLDVACDCDRKALWVREYIDLCAEDARDLFRDGFVDLLDEMELKLESEQEALQETRQETLRDNLLEELINRCEEHKIIVDNEWLKTLGDYELDKINDLLDQFTTNPLPRLYQDTEYFALTHSDHAYTSEFEPLIKNGNNQIVGNAEGFYLMWHYLPSKERLLTPQDFADGEYHRLWVSSNDFDETPRTADDFAYLTLALQDDLKVLTADLNPYDATVQDVRGKLYNLPQQYMSDEELAKAVLKEVGEPAFCKMDYEEYAEKAKHLLYETLKAIGTQPQRDFDDDTLEDTWSYPYQTAFPKDFDGLDKLYRGGAIDLVLSSNDRRQEMKQDLERKLATSHSLKP